jgi:serine/threonine-protein kinase RsbW
MQIDVTLVLPREAASVPLARHVVSAALQGAGVAHDCVDEAEVAVSEACTNVVVHAHVGNRYEVRINIGDEEMCIEVIDAGADFGGDPVQGVPDYLAEGGRGLALVTALTDKAVFDSVTGGGGSVRLVKRLRWEDEAPLPERAVHLHHEAFRNRGDASGRGGT